MSKRQEAKQVEKFLPVSETGDGARPRHTERADVELKRPLDEFDIPVHLRCPLCWGRHKGYSLPKKVDNSKGQTYPVTLSTIYCKCNQTLESGQFGPCGFTWSVPEKTEVLAVMHRPLGDISAR